MFRQAALLLLITFSAGFSVAQGLSCGRVFKDGESVGETAPVPTLALEIFANVQPLSRGNFEAQMGSAKVFLKKLRGGSVQESSWLQFLNNLGLGVKLHGFTKIQDQVFMVIEHAAGVNTQMPMMAPSDFRLTKAASAEIRRQAELLSAEGVSPVDLQFQVSREGQVKIIDPELFRKASSVEAAKKETSLILSNIFLIWAMEGKME